MAKRNLTNCSNASDNDSDILMIKKMKTDTILGCINYISLPSLESIAITKIVVEICRQPDIRNAILRERFNDVEKKISKKLDFLPNILKEKATNIIQPIVMQRIDWNRHYFSSDCGKKLDYVCWTMEGTIDKKKTLELLLNTRFAANSQFMYDVGCRFCLEDHIVNLWSSQLRTKCYLDELFYSKSLYINYEYHLIAYWTCFVKNELSKLLSRIKPSDDADIYDCNHSVNKNMFTLSVTQGNAVAAKYFWSKLTKEEKSDNITIWTELVIDSRKGSLYQETNEYTEILCFLLSQMNDKQQQRKIFQKYSEIILTALFFDWRWRKFLLPTIQIMWDFLDGRIYVDFLSSVLFKETKIGNNIMFLKELWYNSPEDLKSFFIDIWCYRCLNADDFQSIEIFLDLLNSQDQIDEFKKLIIGKKNVLNLFYKHWLIWGKWQSVEKFLNVFYISQDQIDEFKKLIIEKYGVELCVLHWLPGERWRSVKKFLNLFYISQEQIDEFKTQVVRKDLVVYFCYCSWMRNDKWKSVRKFLNLFFTSQNQIDEFKKVLLREHGIDACHHWLVKVRWLSVQKFFDIFFTSQDQIKEFKKVVIRECGIDVCRCWLVEDKWQSVEKFYDLFFTSQDQIYEFKKVVIRKCGTNLCRRWLIKGKWQSLEKFYDLFFTSERQINDFKKVVIRECGTDLCHCWLVKDKWQSVGKFYDIFFTSQDQINEFKKVVIRECGTNLYRYWLVKDKWQSVKKFYALFFTARDQINEFKRVAIKKVVIKGCGTNKCRC